MARILDAQTSRMMAMLGDVTVTVGGVTGKGLRSEEGGAAVSGEAVEYDDVALTVAVQAGAFPALADGGVVRVDEVDYRARSVRPIEDGGLILVALSSL